MNFHSQHYVWAVVLFLALTSCEKFMGDGWPGFRMSEAEYVVLDPDISSMTRAVTLISPDLTCCMDSLMTSLPVGVPLKFHLSIAAHNFRKGNDKMGGCVSG